MTQDTFCHDGTLHKTLPCPECGLAASAECDYGCEHGDPCDRCGAHTKATKGNIAEFMREFSLLGDYDTDKFKMECGKAGEAADALEAKDREIERLRAVEAGWLQVPYPQRCIALARAVSHIIDRKIYPLEPITDEELGFLRAIVNHGWTEDDGTNWVLREEDKLRDALCKVIGGKYRHRLHKRLHGTED